MNTLYRGNAKCLLTLHYFREIIQPKYSIINLYVDTESAIKHSTYENITRY